MFCNMSIPQGMRQSMRNTTYQGVEDEPRTGESGPLVVRIFPPAPGWCADGEGIKGHFDNCRGTEQK
jgi:hypothetical protein